MKRCLVVGAGGGGREILSWALQVQQQEWQVAGFLDDNSQALEGVRFPFGIVGAASTWMPAPDEVFIGGLGAPATRLQMCEGLERRGATFITMIHPTAVQAIGVEIGAGCVISPYAVISANATLGRFVFVNIAASVGHDTRVGDGTTISSHCDIMSYAVIGEKCMLGSHACVLPHKRVGDGATVGAGSAVMRNVSAGTTVVGVPAQLLVPAVVL